MSRKEVDTLVIGGGVVGLSIAYGLVRLGERVRVIDGDDHAFRASRGNFGLLWVQGKGLTHPAYARWSMAAARMWPSFAEKLSALTSIDLERVQSGGLMYCLSEKELTERVSKLADLRTALGGDYPFEVWRPTELKRLYPHLGTAVAGATFGPLDGHVSPLRLLRSLCDGLQRLGGELVTGRHCQQIVPKDSAFQVQVGDQIHTAGRVVLAAGLGNRDLAPMVGLQAPVQPNRGQILVTERMQPFLHHPSGHLRQTGEGVVQIGDSKEDVGLDDGTTLTQLSRIAARACRVFPVLAQVNVVRTWGALRVMTPDGYPIYQQSRQHPGAFVVTCHSGVTLAPLHADVLVQWMRGAPCPPDITSFVAERFDV